MPVKDMGIFNNLFQSTLSLLIDKPSRVNTILSSYQLSHSFHLISSLYLCVLNKTPDSSRRCTREVPIPIFVTSSYGVTGGIIIFVDNFDSGLHNSTLFF